MSSTEYDPYDPYGNWLGGTVPINLPVIVTGTNTNIGTNPIYINVPSGWSTNMLPGAYGYYPSTYEPSQATLTPQILDSLFEKMVTTVRRNEKVIVCVDSDVTSEQMREAAESLTARGFDGIVMRGARAGTGFRGNPQNLTREETRVDILARILELWQQRPELKLTSLLEWYHGEEMNDEDFAAAVEVHFQKVTNGIHQRP
jgi:hypothetical protein